MCGPAAEMHRLPTPSERDPSVVGSFLAFLLLVIFLIKDIEDDVPPIVLLYALFSHAESPVSQYPEGRANMPYFYSLDGKPSGPNCRGLYP
jgi:hypothetical protein